jgi:hypothetical protein
LLSCLMFSVTARSLIGEIPNLVTEESTTTLPLGGDIAQNKKVGVENGD